MTALLITKLSSLGQGQMGGNAGLEYFGALNPQMGKDYCLEKSCTFTQT